MRDIQHHLARTLGTELSHETISKITDAVLDEVKAWQTRPFEEIYPIDLPDALIVKIRDGARTNKAAHIAVGVDLDGVKHVLGIWVQASEGASSGPGCAPSCANRGVEDVLIVCCDGLTGFPEAIEATWPASDRPDLRGAPDPGLHAVRLLPRSQDRRRRAAPDLRACQVFCVRRSGWVSL